ncbi:MAG: hypothetical protein WCL50_05920 [Spirochaetota bacterium]
MPKHEFAWLLDDRTRVVVIFVNSGRAVVRFVVKLQYFKDGEWAEVSRYDVFHGYVHRDMIGKDAEKSRTIKFEFLDMKSGLDAAIVDFKANYRSYVERWLYGK